MLLKRTTIATLLAAFLLSGPVFAASLEDVVAGPQRSADQRAHDAERHPLETLRFFGVKPDMRVVEIDPGDGWMTAILAPYLKDRGQYYAALPPQGASEDEDRKRVAFIKHYANQPDVYGDIHITEMNPRAASQVAPDGTADLVLTVLHVHDWMSEGTAEIAFRAFYDALKPGGILGVVERRAADSGKQDPKASNGYVQQAHVVKLATEAGFHLVGQSEVNANRHDVRDRAPAGSGEGDRMTLKFVKPGGDEHPDGRALKLKEALDHLQSDSH
jgi:predicted methyltransferase